MATQDAFQKMVCCLSLEYQRPCQPRLCDHGHVVAVDFENAHLATMNHDLCRDMAVRHPFAFQCRTEQPLDLLARFVELPADHVDPASGGEMGVSVLVHDVQTRLEHGVSTLRLLRAAHAMHQGGSSHLRQAQM